MKISTVTVCRNSQVTIAQTIESFLRQTHPDKELLVIDGGSTDRTVEIVNGFQSDAIRIISEPDRGIYDAMNKGLANYSGDAVGFLNSDDAYRDSSVLSRISDALGRADAVYGDLVMISDHMTGNIVREWKASEFKPDAFRTGWMPPHPTFYIRRELAARTGEFDTSGRLRFHATGHGIAPSPRAPHTPCAGELYGGRHEHARPDCRHPR